MSHDQSRRSKWSREQVENSNAIDRFFGGAYSLVISVVMKGISPHDSRITFPFEYPKQSFFNSINELHTRSINTRWRTCGGLVEDCRTVRRVGPNEVSHIKFAGGQGNFICHDRFQIC